MDLPPAPFYRRWSFILAGVIGLAAVVALLGWLGFQEADGQPTTSTTVRTTTLPPTTTTEPSSSSLETTSKPDEVLWEARDGDSVGEGFRAPSVWRIEWSFDCSNFEELGSGNFKITGNGAFERIQIERVDVRDSGAEPIRRGGFGHLFVETVCDRWTVRALSG